MGTCHQPTSRFELCRGHVKREAAGVTSYAIVLRARPRTLESILMILDDRKEADDIAFKLRQRGQDVEVVEMTDPVPDEEERPAPS